MYNTRNNEEWQDGTVFIDKITTTNSTGILEVQKNDRLEVMECIFKI